MNNAQRFETLRSLYAEVKRDKDSGEFRDPAEWPPLVPDEIKKHFWWPTPEEREHWLGIRDSDHDPAGAKLERRAIQLGLRGEVLEAFGTRELLEVMDLSAFVAEQRSRLASGGVSALETPRERVYVPSDPAVISRLGLSAGA